MNYILKSRLALSLVVDMAVAVVEIDKIWIRIKPEVTAILKPVLESCKKIVGKQNPTALPVIENR